MMGDSHFKNDCHLGSVVIMNLHSIRWRLPLSYAAIALLAALSLGSVMLLVLNRYYIDMEREYLNGNARALQPVVEQLLKAGVPRQVLQDQVTGLAFLSQTQISVLDANGEIIADSGVLNAKQMIALSAAPAGIKFNVALDPSVAVSGPVVVYSAKEMETAPFPLDVPPEKGGGLPPRVDTVIGVSAAPLGGYGFTTEAVPATDQRSSQVVSIPLNGKLGSLEISNGPAYGSDILRSVAVAWALAGILSIALAAWAGLYVSRQVTRPVLALTEATRRMENGELAARVSLPDEKQQEFLALAHAFNGMAGQVEHTVSTLRAFVSDAAHELNTPLTALKTNLELAAAEPDAARRESFLAHALEQNQRMESLTHSLLDLSRIEATYNAPAFEPLDLRQLVAETGERFASRAEQADRNFNVTLPESEISIRGNAQQIQRVVDNLLENALKFTPTGGLITLSLEQTGQGVMLTVADTGIGIPSEDLPHLFERFHRGRNAAGYPGNGLGLAIVKAVVDAHGGEIRAESTPGRGTKISIRLQV
jgi:signal transduction histidine kinase